NALLGRCSAVKQVATDAGSRPEEQTNHGASLVAWLVRRPKGTDKHMAGSLNDQLKEDLKHETADYTEDSAERFSCNFPNWHCSPDSGLTTVRPIRSV